MGGRVEASGSTLVFGAARGRCGRVWREVYVCGFYWVWGTVGVLVVLRVDWGAASWSSVLISNST